MGDYIVPVFRRLKALPDVPPVRASAWGKQGGRPRTIPDSMAAGIRWDYEHGLLGIAAIVRKWGVSVKTVEGICYGDTYKDVITVKANDA